MDKSIALDLLDGATADLLRVSAWLEDWQPETQIGFPDFPLYGQQWLPWRTDGLGYSSYSTIGGYGCVVCSAAMIVSDVMGEPVTPRDVNNRMKEVGGFVDTNRFIFSALPRAFPAIYFAGFIDCETVAAPVLQIDAQLAAGGYAIAKVDLKLITGGLQEHWLALHGGNAEDGYWACDPWIGTPCRLPPAYCDLGHSAPEAWRWIFGVSFYGKS